MILQQSIVTHAGMLVVPEGQEITQPLLMKLKNFSCAGEIGNKISVLVQLRSTQ